MDKFDSDKSKQIEFSEFIHMMDFIRERKELDPIFDQYKNKESGLIHASDLMKFLTEC